MQFHRKHILYVGTHKSVFETCQNWACSPKENAFGETCKCRVSEGMMAKH